MWNFESCRTLALKTLDPLENQLIICGVEIRELNGRRTPFELCSPCREPNTTENPQPMEAVQHPGKPRFFNIMQKIVSLYYHTPDWMRSPVIYPRRSKHPVNLLGHAVFPNKEVRDLGALARHAADRALESPGKWFHPKNMTSKRRILSSDRVEWINLQQRTRFSLVILRRKQSRIVAGGNA